jgi:hypothetical protein
VESSRERGNEPSGSIKWCELPRGCKVVTSRAVLSSTELVKYSVAVQW